MKILSWRACLSAVALAVSAGAHAAVVDFEDVMPTLFSGTSITSGAFRFTSDAFGFSGVDNASAFSAFGNAPANASGQFLFALNDDGIFMDRIDGVTFYLSAFESAFIAPTGGLGSGILPGELIVQALQADGDVVSETFVYSPSTGSGDFNFTTFTTGVLGTEALQRVYFYACIYESGNQCVSPSTEGIPAQFALDNLDVPEPGSAALAIAALGLLAAGRRKQPQAQALHLA